MRLNYPERLRVGSSKEPAQEVWLQVSNTARIPGVFMLERIQRDNGADDEWMMNS